MTGCRGKGMARWMTYGLLGVAGCTSAGSIGILVWHWTLPPYMGWLEGWQLGGSMVLAVVGVIGTCVACTMVGESRGR